MQVSPLADVACRHVCNQRWQRQKAAFKPQKGEVVPPEMLTQPTWCQLQPDGFTDELLLVVQQIPNKAAENILLIRHDPAAILLVNKTNSL